jgi:hypothetical protein
MPVGPTRYVLICQHVKAGNLELIDEMVIN